MHAIQMGVGTPARPPDPVAAYRQRYRAEHVPAGYGGRRHLAFTTLACLAVLVLAIVQLEDVTALEWLTVPLTFLYANLVEYVGHRGPMHHRTPGLGLLFERHTRQHHRFFTSREMALEDDRDYRAVLFPAVMIVFYLGGFAVPAGLLLAWAISANVAWLFVATAVGYFLNYELLHLAYHAPAGSWPGRVPGVARLGRLHRAHHDPALMQEHNFNVTYPLCDALFGTLHRDPGPGHSPR